MNAPENTSSTATLLAQSVLENLNDTCQCGDGYKSRNLRDPQCEYCNTHAKVLRELATKVLSESSANVFAKKVVRSRTVDRVAEKAKFERHARELEMDLTTRDANGLCIYESEATDRALTLWLDRAEMANSEEFNGEVLSQLLTFICCLPEFEIIQDDDTADAAAYNMIACIQKLIDARIKLPELTPARIREIALENEFTLKDVNAQGEPDLRPYVYNFANAIRKA